MGTDSQELDSAAQSLLHVREQMKELKAREAELTKLLASITGGEVKTVSSSGVRVVGYRAQRRTYDVARLAQDLPAVVESLYKSPVIDSTLFDRAVEANIIPLEDVSKYASISEGSLVFKVSKTVAS